MRRHAACRRRSLVEAVEPPAIVLAAGTIGSWRPAASGGTELARFFVENEMLAILILVAAGAATIFRTVLRLNPAVATFTLLGGCIAALIFCVWRMARIASR